MPFIMMVLGVIGGIGFWWWRMKALGEAASEIHDVAGRAIGKYKRHKFRQKVEGSVLTAVDDPRAAAVIMMFAMINEERSIDESAEKAVGDEIKSRMGIADPTELIVFGKWAASQNVDANQVSRTFGKLWVGALSEEERKDLVRMVARMANLHGEQTPAQANEIAKLRERLALERG